MQQQASADTRKPRFEGGTRGLPPGLAAAAHLQAVPVPDLIWDWL